MWHKDEITTAVLMKYLGLTEHQVNTIKSKMWKRIVGFAQSTSGSVKYKKREAAVIELYICV